MKKGWKIFWIILAACGGTGLVMLIAAFAMGFSFNSLNFVKNRHEISTNNRPENTESDFILGKDEQIDKDENLYEIRELHLYADFCKVEFIENDENRFFVDSSEVEDIDNLKLDISENDGILTVDIDNGLSHGHHIKHHYYDRTLYVYYPKNYKFEKVDIQFGAGEIDIDNLVTDELYIEVGAGECSIDTLTADKVDAVISVGTLEIEGEVADMLNVSCGTGKVDIDLYGARENYNYKLTCQAGTIKVDEERFAGIGTTKEFDNGSSSDIILNCGAGNIEIDFE